MVRVGGGSAGTSAETILMANALDTPISLSSPRENSPDSTTDPPIIIGSMLLNEHTRIE